MMEKRANMYNERGMFSTASWLASVSYLSNRLAIEVTISIWQANINYLSIKLVSEY